MMLQRAPPFGKVPILDDREVLAAKAEQRGEVRAQTGADQKYARYHKMQMRQIGRNLTGQLPGDGEVLFLLSQKDVNTFSLLLWLIENTGPLDDLFVTTFNVNQDIIRAFARLLDRGQVGRLALVISQSIESRKPERIEELRQVWQPHRERFRVSLCWNHSKIALAAAGDERFVLTGSGNYSFNAEIEQYELFHCAALYQFLRAALERRCFTERKGKRHQVWGEDGEE